MDPLRGAPPPGEALGATAPVHIKIYPQPLWNVENTVVEKPGAKIPSTMPVEKSFITHCVCSGLPNSVRSGITRLACSGILHFVQSYFDFMVFNDDMSILRIVPHSFLNLLYAFSSM